ncbi:MAG: DUF3347 domain-containing protein [Sediminibacterium sp.]|nr:DUF3347 domain-containing protein [Sediminibacterium sp.]
MKSIKLFFTAAVMFVSLNIIAQTANPVQPVLNAYIELKDALVKTDGSLSAQKSKTLLGAIETVKMADLNADVHDVWMKVLNELKEDAEHISETKEVSHQRDHFMSLSKNMYAVLKKAKLEVPVYYQFCPMANKGKGANWLSMENKVKNPYYGNQMLTCGKVVETLQ